MDTQLFQTLIIDPNALKQDEIDTFFSKYFGEISQNVSRIFSFNMFTIQIHIIEEGLQHATPLINPQVHLWLILAKIRNLREARNP